MALLATAPTITSADSTTFTVGSAGTFTVTASGYPAPTFTETGSLPGGVTLSSAGVLSGTPVAGSGGSYSIDIDATNGVSPDSNQSFTLTVDQAPSITSGSSTTFAVGTDGSFTVNASGYPAPTFTETGSLPGGVILSSAGVLSGTPVAGSGGTYSIDIDATNGVSPDSNQSFTLTVDQAPSITSGDSATFTVGSAGTFTVTATGYPTPTFTQTGSLPGGVTLSSAGILSGTPAVGTGGSYSITIDATNGLSPDSTQTFTLTVDQAPSITSGDSATFTVGSAGTFTVTATGYPTPTFTQTGSLPGGVTLSSAGVLSGTPIVGSDGSYPIAIEATNGTSPDATQSFTLTVQNLATAPTITSAPSTTFTAGTAGSFTVTATGSPAPTFTETGNLPSGVTLNPTTGALSGIPATGTGGSYPINIVASNGTDPDGTQSFTLTVDEAPAITSSDSTSFTIGSDGSFTVTATGYPAPTYSESGTLPSGVTLNSATGALSGTPSAGTNGSYSITIDATNSVGSDAIQSFTLTVEVAGFHITTTSLHDALVGTPYSVQLTTTGGGTSIVWKKTAALPKGFALSSSGLLTGTPSSKAVGHFNVQVSASSDKGTPVTASIPLTVNEAPAFGSKSPIAASFDEGEAGTVTVTATGYPAPTFSESGGLPSGVTLDATTGVLSGTPPITVNSSSYTITIAATNGIGSGASQSFTLTVYAPLVIATTTLPGATRGAAYSETLQATGGIAPYAWKKTAALPKGLALEFRRRAVRNPEHLVDRWELFDRRGSHRERRQDLGFEERDTPLADLLAAVIDDDNRVWRTTLG